MSTEVTLAIAAVSIVAAIVAVVLAMRRKGAAQASRVEEAGPDDILRAAFERSHACIGFMTGDGNWLEVNRRFTTVLGYGKNDLVMMPMRLMTHADDRRREAPLFGELRSGKRASYVITKRLQKKGGEFRSCRVQMLRCTEGTQNVYQCTIEDLEQNGTWLEMVANALSDVRSTAVIAADASGTITGWSKGAEELFDYPETEIIGRNWSTLQDAKERRNSARIRIAASQGGFMKSIGSRLKKGGEPVRVQSVMIPDMRLGDSNGFLEICTRAEGDDVVQIDAEELAALQRLKASVETKISSFGAAAQEFERLQDTNQNLQAQLVRKEETEAQLRAAVSMLRNANADLSRKVKILTAAVRKMVMARKSDAAALTGGTQPAANAAPPQAEPQWMRFSGGDVDEIVRRTARLQQSGILRMRDGSKEKRLVFEEGQLVACTSDSDDRLLGQLLVDAGIIDEEQRTAALGAHRASGTPFGTSIIELGLATQEDLADIMRTKVTKELTDAASWTQGEFTFVPNEPIARGMVPVALDVLAMLDELDEEQAMVHASNDVSLDAPGGVSTAIAGNVTHDAQPAAGGEFVARAGKKNRVFHVTSCKTAKAIPKAQRVIFATAAEAMAENYAPCERCNPAASRS